RAGNVHFLPPAKGCNLFDNPRGLEQLTGVLAPMAEWHMAPDITIVRGTFGLPGYGEVTANDQRFERAISAAIRFETSLFNDVEIAHYGAFAGGRGTLILAGTGAMAFAGEPGHLIRSGGWGDRIGDEGGAYWIGQRALSLATKTLDGRFRGRSFARDLLAAMDLEPGPDQTGLMNWLGNLTHPRSGIASVAAHVDGLAGKGNRTARSLLRAAADELFLLYRSVHDRQEEAETPWACAGSVFRSSTVSRHLARRVGTPPSPLRLPPLGGALLHAARNAGWFSPFGRTENSWIEALVSAFSASFPHQTVVPATTPQENPSP
ncbi:MAG TPA: hypothetical protein ENJ68_00310, partial [Devosia sp.]|nr:hypothetical protein [Devosia sp.]